MTARKVKEKAQPTHHCIDCANSYDYHTIGAKGLPFLCRCKHFAFCKFLYRDYCDKFILK